jgi:hypothetical protein
MLAIFGFGANFKPLFRLLQQGPLNNASSSSPLSYTLQYSFFSNITIKAAQTNKYGGSEVIEINQKISEPTVSAG